MKIKVRKPLTKNDGAFGYVNVKYVRRIFRSEKYASLELTNGIVIDSLSSYNTLSTNYVIGKSVNVNEIETGYMVK